MTQKKIEIQQLDFRKLMLISKGVYNNVCGPIHQKIEEGKIMNLYKNCWFLFDMSVNWINGPIGIFILLFEVGDNDQPKSSN